MPWKNGIYLGWRADRDYHCCRCQGPIPRGMRCSFFWLTPEREELDDPQQQIRRVAKYICPLCILKEGVE